MSLGLAWERLGDPPGRAGGSVWGEGGLGISAQTAASATRSRTKRMKMDGWMDFALLIIIRVEEAKEEEAEKEEAETEEEGEVPGASWEPPGSLKPIAA
ncbi:hypothetical protein L3Q82_010806 [Scortum barcoo]|uniref:Uncharacterized protein n=1 Tax=Scortum barcoo TaxID=214431 RepID=A0ACB8WAB6_9TELE|nr:hypothetical protein L3Q82_010806 [Scortum barcoo]